MKKQNGITLIALVITIIVLLILAGVSIAMLTGENGILTNATKAQKDTDRENAKEQIDISLQAIKTQALANLVNDSSYNVKAAASITELTDAKVVGNTVKAADSGYTIDTTTTSTDGIIKIKYVNDATEVDLTGSIDLDANTSGGLITEADDTPASPDAP